MNTPPVNTATIPGWGSDADPDNDPAYPIRHIEDLRNRGLDWPRPAPQAPTVEVLASIEHLRLPAVTGTSVPPSGLSGAIRRFAFRRSESDWRHWLLLMGADRINVVEGVIEDLARGKVPNISAEMGVRAESRHNKQELAAKLAVLGAASLAGYLLLRRDRGGGTQQVAGGRTIRPGSDETPLTTALKAHPIDTDAPPPATP